MKSLKKWARPMLLAFQMISVIGVAASLFGKKKAYAGIFAAVGVLATVATFFLNKKESAEKKAEEKWEEENFFDELFGEEELFEDLDGVRDADVSLSIEEELAKSDGSEDVMTDDLSQALKNLEEAGKELEEALGEFENVRDESSDGLKEME